jgi:hypothetical protein
LLDDVVGSFLDSVGEREFDAPLMALLRSHGFTDIFVHGQYEFGKDVIAKSEDGAPVQYVLQSKAGDLGLSQWTGIRGQIDLLRTNELSHPSFDRTLPRRAVLVITGRLIGGAPLEIQDYRRQSAERGETPLEVWDRERLIELMTRSPEAGLAGAAEAPLLERDPLSRSGARRSGGGAAPRADRTHRLASRERTRTRELREAVGREREASLVARASRSRSHREPSRAIGSP